MFGVIILCQYAGNTNLMLPYQDKQSFRGVFRGYIREIILCFHVKVNKGFEEYLGITLGNYLMFPYQGKQSF